MANEYEIPVITHHCINNHPEANPLGIIAFTADELAGHLLYLKDAGYEMISVKELMQRAYAGSIQKSRIAVLTFDDGFLDNYLIVPEILKQFNATGTLFVNPGNATNDSKRTLNEYPNAWGFLNFEEMRALEKQGSLEIQSHTMTHDFSFISDQLVDFYSPQKFSRYYWLIWKLHPFTKMEWTGDVYRFASLVPAGYPIFQWGRCMQAREFIPSKDFVDTCVNAFRCEGSRCLSKVNLMPNKGEYESEQNYSARVEAELLESKTILENELAKPINTICFPGDVYDEKILARAASIGYKVYMRHPREKGADNLSAIQSASTTNHLQTRMVGLRRLGIFSEYPKFLPLKTTAYWITKIAVRGFVGDSFYSWLLSAGRIPMRIKRRMLMQI
jgi:peptidoglycan/xylan/chitin deacetylase (PgdA/CDA1 family)